MAAIQRTSQITNKPPSYPTKVIKDGHAWLDCKRQDDDCDGLWRVHNTLYDLTDFIDKHPGGAEWIRLSKGTDITELVESHHIYPERLEIYFKKYRIRDCENPRVGKLTFEKDGFYVTLRKKVAAKLPYIVKTTPALKSKFYIDALFVITLLTAIAALRYENWIIAVICGVFYTWTAISGHNFFHMRDNHRMKYFNLSFMSYHDWRITHVFSHHMFPNSLLDVEVMLFEPIFCWIPSAEIKNSFQRYGSWLYGPIVYFLLYALEFFKKAILSIVRKNTFYLDDFLPFLFPVVMYIFGGDKSIGDVIKWWLIIITIGAFWFSIVGLNAGHHHPETVHDGDKLRDGLDWGIYNLDTVIDRDELRGNHLLVISNFGDHALHHLFPTLDHGILPELYDVLEETLIEFQAVLHHKKWWHCIVGQFKQLARIEPMQKSSFERNKYFKQQ